MNPQLAATADHADVLEESPSDRPDHRCQETFQAFRGDGPPSPEKPDEPVPATVMTVPDGTEAWAARGGWKPLNGRFLTRLVIGMS